MRSLNRRSSRRVQEGLRQHVDVAARASCRSQEYGQPFVQVVSRQILQPLGLDATTYPTAVDEWGGPHPTGYQPADNGSLQPQDNNSRSSDPPAR